MMNERTLFLAWQDKENREWFPIGRLDADSERRRYRFRYIDGVRRAQERARFMPLWEFPELEGDYKAPVLFPLFRNRLIAPGRADRQEYLRNLDLAENADPIEILTVNGGYRVTDAYEVFPRLVKKTDGSFVCRFFLHGWRHVNSTAQDRIDSLEPEDELYVTLELTNPATVLAVQIQTTDYHMIGWAPRYLVSDLVAAMAESPNRYSARVIRNNPHPAPARQRVLIEMQGQWNRHEPMSDPAFKPLVP